MSLITVTVIMFLAFCLMEGGSETCSYPARLFITAPKKVEALSGSCLLIPCNFRNPVSLTGNPFGVWIKSAPQFADNPENIVFNSSGSVNTYPMEMTGKLKKKNCTTLVFNVSVKYNQRFYFRVESKAFKATASCDPVLFQVTDSPWSPTITTSAGLKDLKEKESVTISCSALTPCPHSPPELTWNLQQDSHTQTEKKTDGTLTTKIQENITLSDTHDGNIITCSVRYPVNEGNQFKTAETSVTLSVSYAPKDTSASISPSGLVSAGSWVNLSCSSRAKPPVSSFTWFKISSEGPVQVSEEQLYRVDVTEGGKFYCVAANDLGNQTSSVILLKGQPSLWGAAVGVIIGIIVLICVACVIWFRKSANQTNHRTQSLVLQEASSAAEHQDIHYEEIDFSKNRPSTESEQRDEDPQNVVYSQVKVCRT